MLVIVARTKPLKTMLLWLMTNFTVANFLTAFVTNYYIYDKIKLPDIELIEKIFNNRKKLAGYRTIRMDFFINQTVNLLYSSSFYPVSSYHYAFLHL